MRHSPGQVTSLEAENDQLRARLQAAESALRLVLASYDLNATEDEDLCHHLRGPMDMAREVLDDRDTPICTECHRPLVVPQTLDHMEGSEGWVCMPCVERSGAAVAWAPSQGGDLPQTPS